MDQKTLELYYQYNIANTTLVETNLEGRVSYEILASVIGQCSDGAWENSVYMEPYWRFISVVQNPLNNKVEIRVSKTQFEKSCMWNRTIWNPYLTKTDQDIRDWFARKIRRIISMEAKDTGAKIPFTKSNQYKMKYLGDWTQTVADAVEVHNSLKNKNNNK